MVSTDFEHINCPICASNEFTKIQSKGQFSLPCHVVICPNDGMVFLNPRWNAKRYDYFYKVEYDDYYRPHVLSDEDKMQKYNGVVKILERLEGVKQNSDWRTVLDVGSGMGWSLEWIKNNYSSVKNVYAIEPSQHCVENLTSQIGAEVVSDSVDTNWHLLHQDRFDFIIMRHVLEHFLNPIEALTKIASTLSDNGVLYVAVPDMMSPRGSLTNYWFRVVHTYYFSQATLIDVTTVAGLVPVKMGVANNELWGVFRRKPVSTEQQSYKASKDTFRKQMKVIQKHKLRNLFNPNVMVRSLSQWIRKVGV